MKRTGLRVGLLLLLIGLLFGVSFERQSAIDWFKLRNYSAPAAVVTLSRDATMTAKAEHLFYVNHPDIATSKDFTSHCPKGGEKTIVLGCYIGNDNGIFLFNVTDNRLNGVEQVTAAHEMLHAAYRRLSTSQRNQVDGWLQDYFTNDLKDPRIKDTIAAYRKSEPNDVVNEMHSVFGTEIEHLPVQLENYYKQYFINRSSVTTYAAQYQSEFTNRQNQIKTYDSRLVDLKGQIDSSEASLTQQKTTLDAQNQQMQSERSSGNIGAYNSGVAAYNTAIIGYNQLVATTKISIDRYNSIVSLRNSIAVEEQQLSQAISSDSLNSQ